MHIAPSLLKEVLQQGSNRVGSQSMSKLYCVCRVIILDGDAQSVLSDSQASQLDDERILGIWRAQTLALGSLQNGPLLNGSAYLAKLEGDVRALY